MQLLTSIRCLTWQLPHLFLHTPSTDMHTNPSKLMSQTSEYGWTWTMLLSAFQRPDHRQRCHSSPTHNLKLLPSENLAHRVEERQRNWYSQTTLMRFSTWIGVTRTNTLARAVIHALDPHTSLPSSHSLSKHEVCTAIERPPSPSHKLGTQRPHHLT